MLHRLNKIKTKSKKRVGRGGGSGKGLHTSGRGQKGQNSRAGRKHKVNFAGGANAVGRKLPVRRGFQNNAKAPKMSIRIDKLNKLEETEITMEFLRKEFKVDKHTTVKLVAGGELKRKVNIIDVPMTASVKKMLE